MKVIFNHHGEQTVLAEATEDQTLQIEGNTYFAPETVNMEYFSDSETPYTCPWKGVCQYHNANVEGHAIEDIAWSYPEPKDGSRQRVATENDGKLDGDFAGFICFDFSKEGVELTE